jgi:C4-type Zn-finger protein
MSHRNDGGIGISMSFWKRKKCPLCKSVIKPKYKTMTFQIDTADGVLEIHDVCPKCTYVMEQSANVLQNNRMLRDDDDV